MPVFAQAIHHLHLLIDNAFASSQYKFNKLQYQKYNNRIKNKIKININIKLFLNKYNKINTNK